MDPILARFAEFSSTLSYRSIPAPAVAAAKDRLVDTLGCAIAAHDCDTAEIGRSLAGPAARPELAGRILTSRRTVASDAAAFVNACMIRKLDLNDIIQGGHPSDMLGALLAIAPQIGASGERLITAMVVSYEVLIRLRGRLRVRRAQDRLCFAGRDESRHTSGVVRAAFEGITCMFWAFVMKTHSRRSTSGSIECISRTQRLNRPQRPSHRTPPSRVGRQSLPMASRSRRRGG